MLSSLLNPMSYITLLLYSNDQLIHQRLVRFHSSMVLLTLSRLHPVLTASANVHVSGFFEHLLFVRISNSRNGKHSGNLFRASNEWNGA